MSKEGWLRIAKGLYRKSGIRLPAWAKGSLKRVVRALGADVRDLLIVSVDVEASPYRQSDRHVERLVWGRFGDQEVGIGRMMDIADRFRHKLTFFVDYCETGRYPGAFEEITQTILRRGHDVQIHAHPTMLEDGFFERRGLPRAPESLNDYGDDHAEALVDFLVSEARRCGLTRPVAFRGGNFEVSPAILRALKRHGITQSYSYNVARLKSPGKTDHLSMFRWENGVTEVPVGQLQEGARFRRFDISEMDFSDTSALRRYQLRYFRTMGEHAVLVAVLHSFALCDFNPLTKFHEYRDEHSAEDFENLFRHLPDGIRIITATQLEDLLQRDAVRPVERRELAWLTQKNKRNLKQEQKQKPSAPIKAPASQPPGATAVMGEASAPVGVACGFCGTPAEKIQDYRGRPRVYCPRCGSLERQRAFLKAYEEFIRPEFDLAGKKILLVGPSEPVLRYLRGVAQVVTADVRPIGCDLNVDISNMPQVASGSFDAIVAKAVLQHCLEDEAALDEFKRVLKPLGRVLIQTNTAFNRETRLAEDRTAYYGQESLEKYRVGTFRYYGDRSLLRSLQRRFLVKTFYGEDPVTGKLDVFFCGIKARGSDA